MTRLTALSCASALTLISCAPRSGIGTADRGPRTRAERSNFTETSTWADVSAFLDSLGQLQHSMARGVIGRTNEGREIPYVIVSRPLVDSPEAAHRTGRPVVYVQGNIHAGEVEGKEALQALLRDYLLEAKPNVLDSLVLIAVPIYNADGNEKFDRQARNRGAQNGPEMVGQRPNAQGLDLNRDYIKADAPETRASLAAFNRWDPHVFVDLHTTNGSYHGYHLTWAPSLNPAAELPGATFGGAWARDSLLPEVQRRTAARHGVKIFPYGNFTQDESMTGAPRAWVTYDHRPRFGTNYYALRGRVAVLSEAYSHDPFVTRVRSTHAFLRELLSLVAERGPTIVANAARSDSALARGIPGMSVPVRAVLSGTPSTGEVVYEVLERTSDTTAREPGVRTGMRRTGKFVTAPMSITDRFVGTRRVSLPWGWAIPGGDTASVALIRRHGLEAWRLREAWSGDPGPQFVVDSTVVAARPFQGRREVRLEGRWTARGTLTLPAGTIVVPAAQRLGVLAAYLLEPESDDGVIAWDVGGRVAAGAAANVPWRLDRALSASLERLPTEPR